jgi:transcription antitermination factor NusG
MLLASREPSSNQDPSALPVLSHTVPEGEDLHATESWYAVYTCANREKQVAARFASRGIEHFLPLYESVREWSDRRVKLQMPLFPGYLFVSAALRNQLRILTVPGVVNLVSSAGRPLPMTGDVIQKLRETVERVAAQPYPYLPVGQRVLICAGPLRGWTGILLRHKAGTRVVISIDLIQRAFVADVDANDLVPDGPLIGLSASEKIARGEDVRAPRGKDFPFRTP